MPNQKEILHRYLQTAREALLWKLDGLSDYDVRRPLTPSGTNLLGIVKHVASVEIGYFTEVFGRPCPVSLPWFDDGAEPNADFLVTVDESREFIIDLYHQSWRASDATINDLDLEHPGIVPWWGEASQHVTLQHILVHMTTETHRHAGHADIVREFIDGARGFRAGSLNLPGFEDEEWRTYYEKVNASARHFLTNE